jgi:hypothetical protein
MTPTARRTGRSAAGDRSASTVSLYVDRAVPFGEWVDW